MAKSQFTVLELVDDGKLSAEGKTQPDGQINAPSLPVTHLHVAVVQDGRVFRADGSTAPAHPTTWGFVGPSNGIEAGEAQAFGLAVQFLEEPLAFETFAWVQTLPVKAPAAGA